MLAALLVALAVSCYAQVSSLQSWNDRSVGVVSHDVINERFKFLPPLHAIHGDAAESLELLDVCVVASVDGKLHALNRTSGRVLWTMSSSSWRDEFRFLFLVLRIIKSPAVESNSSACALRRTSSRQSCRIYDLRHV